jgi:hypothetical protein
MKYLCLVYLDEQNWSAVPDRECKACGEALRAGGHHIAAEALQPVHTATTVRVRNGKVAVTDGPFAETKEQLAGFYLVDAADLNEAIQLAAKIPPARAGSVEVRPVRELAPLTVAGYRRSVGSDTFNSSPRSARRHLEENEMRFMVMVKATKESERGLMPDEKMLAAMGKFNEELVKAGIMLAGEGLHPTSKGARVRFSGTRRTVIDGPFAETKELVAGYWIWKVKSKEEAIEWVKRCPNPMPTDSEIEIRQIFEAEDFGAEFTPELREQEERLRAEIAGRK